MNSILFGKCLKKELVEVKKTGDAVSDLKNVSTSM